MSGWVGDIVILASCENHFNRVYENLMQHPILLIKSKDCMCLLTHLSVTPDTHESETRSGQK